jgi:hypothetical protein
MPVRRFFRDKPVRRTARVGDLVAVTFAGAPKGARAEKVLVPLREYLAGLTKVRLAPDSARPPSQPAGLCRHDPGPLR